jgi:hypothetical protein
MKSSVHTSVLFFLLRNQRSESFLVLFRVPPRPPARGALRDRDPVANDLLEVVLGVESLAVGAAFEWCAHVFTFRHKTFFGFRLVVSQTRFPDQSSVPFPAQRLQV